MFHIATAMMTRKEQKWRLSNNQRTS